MLNLPIQNAVDRRKFAEPFTVKDPEYRSDRQNPKVIEIQIGPLPGDPPYVLRPLGPLRGRR